MSKVRNSPDVDRQLESMLFGGYSAYAIARYREMKQRPSTLFEGAWGLARALYAVGNLDGAYEELLLAKQCDPTGASTLSFRTIEIETLRQLGQVDHARKLAMSLHSELGDRALACFLVAATHEDEQRLYWINRLYEANNVAPLRKRDRNSPLDVHNLTADARSVDGPMVSVIMPAFNAEETIRTAARGILEQTWRNIELIIVDDRSTDGTWTIIQQIASSDDRVRVIQQPRNGGAYAARNAGLDIAKGDFITVNDSDDWSHPQRIEVQMNDLQQGHHLNTTQGARVTADLIGVIRPKGRTPLVENTSSLLTRRSSMLDLGGWDEVRFSADSELYQRLMQHLAARERRVLKNAPMAFIVSIPTSLTKQAATGLTTLHYGARFEYWRAAAHWRETSSRLRVERNSRPFPIPRLVTGQRDVIEIDTLLIADMTRLDSLGPLKKASAEGRTGVLHMPCAENYGSAYHPDIRAFIHEHNVEVIVAGQSVECRIVLIPDEECVKVLPDRLPTISAEVCKVAGAVDVSALRARKVVRMPKHEPLPQAKAIAAVDHGIDHITDLSVYRRAYTSKKLAALEEEIRKLQVQREAKRRKA